MGKVPVTLLESLVSSDTCTPISINASDTTEYFGTKTNLASTILQSTKKFP